VPHLELVLLGAFAAAPIAWLVWSSRRRTAGSRVMSADGQLLLILSVIVLVPYLVLGIMRGATLTLVYPRHMMVAVPGLLLLEAVAIDRIGSRRLQHVLAGVLVVLFVGGLIWWEVDDVNEEDWRGASLAVASHSAETTPVYVAPADEELPFLYYYPWPQSVVPLPGAPHLEREIPGSSVIHDTTVLASRMPAATDRRPFWLLVAERTTAGEFGRSILEGYVGRHYRVLQDTAVYNVSMRLLEARSP
jgi:hypothetical protein